MVLHQFTEGRLAEREAVQAAVVEEMAILKYRFKFLPNDLLRGRALKNLGIPSCFDGRTRIAWARIGSDFVRERVRSKAADQSVVPSYGGPRKFFQVYLPRPPGVQHLHGAPRVIRVTGAGGSTETEAPLDEDERPSAQSSHEVSDSESSLNDDDDIFTALQKSKSCELSQVASSHVYDYTPSKFERKYDGKPYHKGL